MSDDYLISKGWRKIGEKRLEDGGKCHLWAHDDHAKNDGRFYTKGEAQTKQQFIDKPWKYTDPDAEEL